MWQSFCNIYAWILYYCYIWDLFKVRPGMRSESKETKSVLTWNILGKWWNWEVRSIHSHTCIFIKIKMISIVYLLQSQHATIDFIYDKFKYMIYILQIDLKRYIFDDMLSYQVLATPMYFPHGSSCKRYEKSGETWRHWWW